jgi:hypothetical protein
MPRIFLLTHFKDDSEEMIGPYSSIKEAVEQQSSYKSGMHYDIEFSYCGELCKTAHSNWYWLNRTEDFIAEWVKRDECGPRMRVPSQRKTLMAAE